MIVGNKFGEKEKKILKSCGFKIFIIWIVVGLLVNRNLGRVLSVMKNLVNGFVLLSR